MTVAPQAVASTRIETEAQLRALIGEPAALTCAKISHRLNPMTRQFVERSPFVCVATSDRDGNCDLSPRGDPPGFVQVLDDCTLLLPERPGNRLADSLRNILANPRIGLLFVVPGVTDTFRINGRATITVDADLLAPCAVDGKAPLLGIVVAIDEAYTQCSKALLRSQLWDPARFVDPATMPTGGQVHRAIQGEGFDAEQYDQERAERYRRRVGFYRHRGWRPSSVHGAARQVESGVHTMLDLVRGQQRTHKMNGNPGSGRAHSLAVWLPVATEGATPQPTQAYDDAFKDFDLLPMPTLPITASKLSAPTASVEENVGRALEMIANTAPFDSTGHPAMSIPCGLAASLPVGLMRVGRKYEEGTIYRGAHAFEVPGDWRTV